MAKNVAHASKGKSLSSGEANENERRGWSEKSYRRKNENRFNNYDWSRRNLNFEIKDGKIIPLGSQQESLYRRYHNLLKNLDFSQYKDGATNQRHTYVELIMSGSTERMQKIAFGDQHVNYERNPEQWQNWNVKRTTGEHSIEEWAMDVYNFMCKKYGKENIIGFEVHLDETEPHIHVNIVPTAIKQVAGREGGYHKIMLNGDGTPALDDNGKTIPARYAKGKHVGEVIKISGSKYEALSDEKKKEYRQNERGTIRTISFAEHFGSTKAERSAAMSKLHDDYFAQVGKKWGFERGDVWALLPEEERRRRRNRTKEQAGLEREANEAREKAEKRAQEAVAKADAAVLDAAEKDEILKKKDQAISFKNSLLKYKDGELQTKNAELHQVHVNIDKAKGEEAAAVEAAGKAIETKNILTKEVKDLEDAKADNQRIVQQQQDTIDGQRQDIGENVTLLDTVRQNLNDTTNAVNEKEQELRNVEGDVRRAKESLATAQKQKEAIQKDIDLMAEVKGIMAERVDYYIQALPDVSITLNAEVRKKLISPVGKHPRTTSPMDLKELQRVIEEELGKIIMDKGTVWNPVTKEERNERMKAVLTDMTTILINVVGERQKSDIAKAQGGLYKAVRRKVAMATSDTVKVRDMEREGIKDVSQVKELKETAGKAKATEDMLEYAWPGVTKAKNILVDPILDSSYMTGEQKENIRGILRKDPRNRIDDIMRLLKYACSFRDIPVSTRGEAIEAACSSIIKAIAERGYDLVEEAKGLVGEIAKDLEMTVAEAAASTASAAACLIYGYLDAATTVSQGCGGGGGGNNDLPKKKDDEDLKSFFGRCLGAAVGMMKPAGRKNQWHR